MEPMRLTRKVDMWVKCDWILCVKEAVNTTIERLPAKVGKNYCLYHGRLYKKELKELNRLAKLTNERIKK